jgi:RNA polymerase sigma-70 factor (ECF subfamily)
MMEGSATFKGMEIIDSLLDHYDTVYRICLGFTKNPWDAEELMQEVYLRALQKIDSLKDHNHSKIWLFRIARNTCLNFVKKQRMSRIFLSKAENSYNETDNPEWQMLHSENLEYFKKAVSNLPKKQKDVFILKIYGHLSYREISEILNINEGTVMSRLNRARLAVKAQWNR